MDSDEKEGEWKKVERGNKINKKVDPYYILISNRYASLPAFSAPPDPIQIASSKVIKTPLHHQSHYRLKVERRRRKQWAAKLSQLRENEFFDDQITFAEDESTTMAKNDTTNARNYKVRKYEMCIQKSMTFEARFFPIKQANSQRGRSVETNTLW